MFQGLREQRVATSGAGERARLAALFDVAALWRARFTGVRARALPCGHFLAEELPDETGSELESFLGSA